MGLFRGGFGVISGGLRGRRCGLERSMVSEVSRGGGDGILPVVDVSALLVGAGEGKDEAAWRATASAVDQAFRNSGFLYVVKHGVREELMEAVLRVSREFFAQEQSAKDRIHITRNEGLGSFIAPVRGYQRVGDNITQGRPDQHEGVDFYRPCPPGDPQLTLYEDRHPMAGDNKWPEAPKEFKRVMEEYVGQMKLLGAAIVEGIALVNDVAVKELESQYDDPFWCMRVIRYPPKVDREEDGDNLGCGEHTDYGCLTFVHQDETPSCLQVKTPSGSWSYAEPIKNAFVVNCGDMLSRWTNRTYRSTAHRVLSPSASSRVSIPFFFEPNFHASIRPLGPFVEETDASASVPPVHFGTHVSHRVLSNFRYSPQLENNASRSTGP